MTEAEAAHEMVTTELRGEVTLQGGGGREEKEAAIENAKVRLQRLTHNEIVFG